MATDDKWNIEVDAGSILQKKVNDWYKVYWQGDIMSTTGSDSITETQIKITNAMNGFVVTVGYKNYVFTTMPSLLAFIKKAYTQSDK